MKTSVMDLIFICGFFFIGFLMRKKKSSCVWMKVLDVQTNLIDKRKEESKKERERQRGERRQRWRRWRGGEEANTFTLPHV